MGSIVQGELRRLTGWAPVRFLRFTSTNDGLPAVRDREGKEAEEVEVGGDEVVGGGGGGPAADGDGGSESSSYTDQEVLEMLPITGPTRGRPYRPLRLLCELRNR